MSSLPSRERGLKFAFRQGQINSVIRSLPSRERGLKSYKAFECRATMSGSLPSRERGLKLRKLELYFMSRKVAPFAGAWIEILRGGGRPLEGRPSLPSRERGLK